MRISLEIKLTQNEREKEKEREREGERGQGGAGNLVHRKDFTEVLVDFIAQRHSQSYASINCSKIKL